MGGDRSVSRREFLKGTFARSPRIDEVGARETILRPPRPQREPEVQARLERILEEMDDLSGIVEP